MSQRYPNANYPTAYDEANMAKSDSVLANETQFETQLVTHDGTGGDFTLSFNGEGPTSAIAYDATAADVKTELELLASITTANVTGGAAGPWTVEIIAPGPSNLPLMTGDDTGLTGETLGLVITLVQDGSSSLHVTTAAIGPL